MTLITQAPNQAYDVRAGSQSFPHEICEVFRLETHKFCPLRERGRLFRVRRRDKTQSETFKCNFPNYSCCITTHMRKPRNCVQVKAPPCPDRQLPSIREGIKDEQTMWMEQMDEKLSESKGKATPRKSLAREVTTKSDEHNHKSTTNPIEFVWVEETPKTLQPRRKNRKLHPRRPSDREKLKSKSVLQEESNRTLWEEEVKKVAERSRRRAHVFPMTAGTKAKQRTRNEAKERMKNNLYHAGESSARDSHDKRNAAAILSVDGEYVPKFDVEINSDTCSTPGSISSFTNEEDSSTIRFTFSDPPPDTRFTYSDSLKQDFIEDFNVLAFREQADRQENGPRQETSTFRHGSLKSNHKLPSLSRLPSALSTWRDLIAGVNCGGDLASVSHTQDDSTYTSFNRLFKSSSLTDTVACAGRDGAFVPSCKGTISVLDKTTTCVGNKLEDVVTFLDGDENTVEEPSLSTPSNSILSDDDDDVSSRLPTFMDF